MDGVLPIEVFSAFGAAAIGYFTSLPFTFAGGLLIGVVGALLDKYAATTFGSPASGEPSFHRVVPGVDLHATGAVGPRRLAAVKPTHRPYYAPTRVRLSFGVVVIALLLVPIPAGVAPSSVVGSADRHHFVPVLGTAGPKVGTNLTLPAGVRSGRGGRLRALRRPITSPG